MRLFGFFQRNGRWRRQVDAHVDGRLTPVERALLAERLEESPALRHTFEESLALKRILRAMPELPVPHSFAITEAMLAGTAPAPRRAPRGARVTMRFSQTTALAALLAFGALVAIDLREAGDDSTPAAAGDIALAATATDTAASPGEGAVAPEVAPQPTGVANEAGGAQRNAESGSFYDQASPAADTAALTLASEETPGRDYLPLYAALGGVLTLAVAAWTVSRRQLKRAVARY